MASLAHPPSGTADAPHAVGAQAWMTLPLQATRALACLPFDLLRAQHARAVQAGLLPRSLLASRDFERTLGALERAALGPLARRV
jgi:hypothetical protein